MDDDTMAPDTDDRASGRIRLLAMIVFTILVVLEIVAAEVAWETEGEIHRGFTYSLVLLNVPLVALARWRPVLGVLGALALALVIVPPQARLCHRLFQVQQESAAVVAFAFERRLETGRFPADFEDYRPRRPAAMDFIRYGASDEGDTFGLTYFVSTPNVSHYYLRPNGQPGYWGYYPD